MGLTSTLYDQEPFPYPYKADDGREDAEAEGFRVGRGGSWDHFQFGARAACRYRFDPNYSFFNIGFRVVVSSPFSPL